MPPWKYPLPTASPFADAQQYIPLLLGIIDLELNRPDVWELEEIDDALGYVQDLKQYIMLNFGAPAQGGNMDYVQLSYTLAAGTQGGSTSTGAFYTYPLNTKNIDLSGICTLASNQFTLPSGTYRISAKASFFGGNVNTVKLRLYNVSDATVTATGMNIYNAGNMQQVVNLDNQFTLSGTATLRLEYRASIAVTSVGLGNVSNFGLSEVYGLVELWKIS